MKSLILIGGGGHCKSCIDVIEHCKDYQIAGVLDTAEHVGSNILGYPVIGTDDDIPSLAAEHCFLITVGQIASAGLRMKLYERVKGAGGHFASIQSPLAYVSKHSNIGEGTIVLHGAVINAAVIIGDNCIINTGANIEHDCHVGKHVHVSTHAVLNGNCMVEDESFIGSNAVLVNGVHVRSNIVIGAGAVVYKSLTEQGTYAGNPCRKLK